MRIVSAVVDEWDVIVRVLVAAVLGGVVGWDRELADKPAGVRTHMLVAAGAAVFVGGSLLIGSELEVAGTESARIDVSRVMAGVVTGVGFLGAGAIITGPKGVSGLTTAAGIWLVAGIGAAIALGYWWLGVVAAALTLLIQMAQFLAARVRGRASGA